MTAELYGFTLLLRIQRQSMTQDFDPKTDYSLADLPATDDQISRCFRELPWLRNLKANGKIVSRKEWVEQSVKKNGHKVYNVT